MNEPLKSVVSPLTTPILKASKKSRKKKKKKQEITRASETVFRSHYRNLIQLTAIADNKANIIISVNGLIISVLLAVASLSAQLNAMMLYIITTLISGSVSSMVLAVIAARPQITIPENHHDTSKDKFPANLFFFGTYSKLSEQQFVTHLETLLKDPAEIHRQLGRDMYNLGFGLITKYRLIQWAYNFFLIGLVSACAIFIFSSITMDENQLSTRYFDSNDKAPVFIPHPKRS